MVYCYLQSAFMQGWMGVYSKEKMTTENQINKMIKGREEESGPLIIFRPPRFFYWSKQPMLLVKGNSCELDAPKEAHGQEGRQ